MLNVSAILKLLHTDLQGVNDFDLYCPQVAPLVGAVCCTCHHWFQPYSKSKCYCRQNVSSRRMQRILLFKLSSHSLSDSVETGCFARRHVERADRLCSHCVDGSVA